MLRGCARVRVQYVLRWVLVWMSPLQAHRIVSEKLIQFTKRLRGICDALVRVSEAQAFSGFEQAQRQEIQRLDLRLDDAVSPLEHGDADEHVPSTSCS
jgi:hypothetical protein